MHCNYKLLLVHLFYLSLRQPRGHVGQCPCCPWVVVLTKQDQLNSLCDSGCDLNAASQGSVKQSAKLNQMQWLCCRRVPGLHGLVCIHRNLLDHEGFCLVWAASAERFETFICCLFSSPCCSSKLTQQIQNSAL